MAATKKGIAPELVFEAQVHVALPPDKKWRMLSDEGVLVIGVYKHRRLKKALRIIAYSPGGAVKDVLLSSYLTENTTFRQTSEKFCQWRNSDRLKAVCGLQFSSPVVCSKFVTFVEDFMAEAKADISIEPPAAEDALSTMASLESIENYSIPPPAGVIMQGQMKKRSGTVHLFANPYDNRWFVLTADYLRYYASKKDSVSTPENFRGEIELAKVSDVTETTDSAAQGKGLGAFDVVTPTRTYTFFAKSVELSQEWMDAIRSVVMPTLSLDELPASLPIDFVSPVDDSAGPGLAGMGRPLAGASPRTGRAGTAPSAATGTGAGGGGGGGGGDDGSQTALTIRVTAPGEVAGQVFVILRDTATIGSLDANTITLQDWLSQSVSRNHAQIEWDDSAGCHVIVDRNSSNGTYVQGARLPPGVPHVLTTGDIITLGQYVTFKAEIEKRATAVIVTEPDPAGVVVGVVHPAYGSPALPAALSTPSSSIAPSPLNPRTAASPYDPGATAKVARGGQGGSGEAGASGAGGGMATSPPAGSATATAAVGGGSGGGGGGEQGGGTGAVEPIPLEYDVAAEVEATMLSLEAAFTSMGAEDCDERRVYEDSSSNLVIPPSQPVELSSQEVMDLIMTPDEKEVLRRAIIKKAKERGIPDDKIDDIVRVGLEKAFESRRSAKGINYANFQDGDSGGSPM